jgi:FLYWCH zinc finger domain
MDENDEIQVTETKKGKKKLIVRGYEYVFNKTQKEGVKFVCRYQAGECVKIDIIVALILIAALKF